MNLVEISKVMRLVDCFFVNLFSVTVIFFLKEHKLFVVVALSLDIQKKFHPMVLTKNIFTVTWE